MTADVPQAPYPPGARILARDEEWLVRSVVRTEHDGNLIKAIGVSEFVQDERITLFDALEPVSVLRPEDTRLVMDTTQQFRQSRLFLEAVLRSTPLPRAERGLALADKFLLDPMPYQQRPAELALSGLRPRVLIADVVGLGKTLEIGLTLAELIRRGRGERILVATPQHVLEQFQHELWTRFAIPLVRLDSVGIERIQREIPAGRNPFTYFKRVIVSIDTLKNVGLYGHHLEATRWDAVVIDESHNLIGETTQRNRLARLLAAQTDALLLASATPHNGDKRSFAELIRLLDPAAIADPGNYSAKDIEHLYIRRTKISPEVRDRTAGRWADRGPSTPVRCAATPAEEKIFEELTEVWLAGEQRADGPVVDRKNRLFPYTLLKAFLSSHHALWETVTARLYTEETRSKYKVGGKYRPHSEFASITEGLPQTGLYRDISARERIALRALQDLLEMMSDDDSAKLATLVDLLTELGVGADGNDTRVVVFSERIRTLHWLAEVIPTKLGLDRAAVRVMHGGLTDSEQQKIVEEFSLKGSSVRLLFTGDVASEGVNLHRECHQLIHYDLPWSLIRIEQRNGRIDRYGQLKAPQFTALVLISAVEGAKDDTTVAEKLLMREQEVHLSLGSADACTGEYVAEKEERRLTEDLLRGRTVEESLADAQERDVLAELLADVGQVEIAQEPAKAMLPSVFESTEAFVDEALRVVYPAAEDELGLHREQGLIALDAPPDLEHRLSDLPRSYLAAQRQEGRLRLLLTFDRDLAQRKLVEARESKTTIWPDIAFLSDVHPVVNWLVDKVLVRLGRQQAPVLVAGVAEPVFLVQGVYCNHLAQPTVVEWMAVTGLPDSPVVRPMDQVLKDAGVGPGMSNALTSLDLDRLQDLVPLAIDTAREHLEGKRVIWDELVAQPLRAQRDRVDQWEQLSLDIAAGGSLARKHKVGATANSQRDLIDRLETTGEPLLRLLAVLERTP